MKKYNVAIVGVTGAVGEKLLRLLENAAIEINELHVLASARSKGKKVLFRGEELTVAETTESAFAGIDIAFFSAGGAITKKFHRAARNAGAIVIDNTSAFRMDAETPLVVPEVNPEALRNHTRLIANPNCSTIQMVAALKPIEAVFGLSRVIVSTYQAVSGAGLHALEELENQTKAVLAGEEPIATILPSGGDKKHYPIAFNAIPQIDLFSEDGYTFEEWKMMNETKKIMGRPDLKIAATCVRIPVMSGHSESLYLEVDQEDVTADAIRKVLSQAPGIVLQDDPSTQTYPMVTTAVNQKETYVGRVRRDVDNPKGFHMWVVSDNLIKGAAWNSIQIAEKMIEMGLV